MGVHPGNILVYGWLGIGKTAFILEVLDTIENETAKETLTIYQTLPPDKDLIWVSLIALAQKMPDDHFAQQILEQIGLPVSNTRKASDKHKINLKFYEYENLSEIKDLKKVEYPIFLFEQLLSKARDQYKKIVIAIDDLDKLDPARARELLLDAQGLLKTGVYFILSGHPAGLTRDFLISARGIFDLPLEIKQMDYDTTYTMLINYLNSVRSETNQKDYDDPEAVKPFTPEAAKFICKKSIGVPRLLNRLGGSAIRAAIKLNVDIITPNILEDAFKRLAEQLPDLISLDPKEKVLLQFICDKGSISDEDITLDELQQLDVKDFNELLPILDRLKNDQLILRKPTEEKAEFTISPLLDE